MNIHELSSILFMENRPVVHYWGGSLWVLYSFLFPWQKFQWNVRFVNNLFLVIFKTRHKIVAGYYGLTLDVHVSVRPSVVRPSVRPFFRFRVITSKHQWIFFKLGMCIDIMVIWFGIANGQISLFFTELSARDTPIFSFPDDNLSKHQRIFTKLGMCIDIVEIGLGLGLGLLMGKFCQILTELSARGTPIFTWVNVKGF